MGSTVNRLIGSRPVRIAALGVLAAVLAITALVVGRPAPPAPVSAAPPLCRNVALDRGLSFRGAYGTTPFAINPMSAMMLRNMGNGAAVADVFGDGRLSVLMLGQLGHSNRLFRNQPDAAGKASFVDVTDAAGLASKGGSRAAAFADLDDDGQLDLIVLNDWDGAEAGSPSRIHRNQGDGTFADVTKGSGFAPVGYLVGGLSLADYNRDGRLDLYVTYWTMELGGDPALDAMKVKGRFPGMNRLYENLGGFTFRDVTADVHLGQVTADSFSSIFADFTADGWPDLYVAIDHREDLFYENVNGVFRLASEERGVGHIGNDMGIAATDLGSDGTIDLYVTNITDPNDQFGTGSGNTLLVGKRAADGALTYADTATAAGVEDTGWGWGAVFTDVDLDGRLDLYAVQGMQEFIAGQSPELRNQKARLFLGTADDGFELAKDNGCDVAGDQRSVIPFDYDRDGAPDLLVTQMAYRAVLLENGTADRHWLTVDLSRAGALAAGARVTVTTAESPTTQVALYGGSYLAGMPMELYFGLGSAASAEVSVTWADGTVDELGTITADQVLRLTPDGVRS
ncbi:MAG: CRTAC1 family protein [Chloroflexota bacterium]|nr:CRTAC1 family protein [Chloroflexota bacterium]